MEQPTLTAQSGWHRTVEQYLSVYAGGSVHTKRAKATDLTKFTTFLAKFQGVPSSHLLMSHWDAPSVEQFIEEALAQGVSPATVARRLATLKHLGRTLAERFTGFINPAREAKTPKIQPPVPQALSPAEIKDLLEHALLRSSEKNTFIRNRNITIVRFMLDTGLRADEVRLMRMSQLDEKLEWAHRVRTKGRRYREVYITSAIRQPLQAYLDLRTAEFRKRFPTLNQRDLLQLPLFPSYYRAKTESPESFLMGAKTLWRAVQELSVGTKLHPHLLRHSYAVDLLGSSKDIRLVSQALGHGDVRITMRYTERSGDEVKAALEKSRAERNR